MLCLTLLALVGAVTAQLPEGCVNLADTPFSDVDPLTIFPENRELEDVAPPRRLGPWRSEGMKPLPTQHFVMNQAKAGGEPAAKLEPYTMFMDNEGISYDAYSLDRWSDPDRTDEMLQQTPSAVDRPWDKMTQLGTNMRQVSTGPDGNVFGTTYTGRSGIRVGIYGSGDPIWEDYTEMSANFRFSNSEDGSLEVPLTRGNSLLPHLFTNANPRLTPFCLSSVNGQSANYMCPMEGGYIDGGEGFIEGSCEGSTLHITLYTTKSIPISNVQWAATPLSEWPGGMNTCGPECQISDNGRQVDIYLDDASGEMGFAVNVIGRFIIPPDWTNQPETATCSLAKAGGSSARSFKVEPKPELATSCGESFCQTPSCEYDGNENSFELTMEFEDPVSGIDVVQIASSNSDDWSGGAAPPMITCTEEICELEDDGTTLIFSSQYSSESVAYAVNVIGRAVYPPGDWINEPYRYTCGDEVPTDSPPTDEPGPTDPAPTGDLPDPDPQYCADIPASVTCTSAFCQHSFCQANPADSDYQDVKIVMVLDQPLSDIDQIQVAISNTGDWTGAMLPCNSEYCSLSTDGFTLTYCRTFPTGGISFAVNVIGRFTRPQAGWLEAPYQFQCGGQGEDLGSGSKFILELDEPGTSLPDQTRRYVAYFSEDMNVVLDAGGLSFAPTTGGQFTGLMQLGYLGTGARGDTSDDDFYDDYEGVFPYMAETSMCVDDDKGYINFNWNKRDLNGPTDDGELMMIAYPHHWGLIGENNLIDTPFGFRGRVADEWLLEEDLPHASMEPLEDAVDSISSDQEKLDDIRDALDRDLEGMSLDDRTCDSGGSYWAGKDIGFAARTASISRAFGTNHHEDLDERIRMCLDRWLRVNDTLSGANRFWYDTVMGGLFSRCVPDEEPVIPHANFGFPIFADHHFHLGYWVYAAGYYALYYPEWFEEEDRRERILLLARDIGNPSMNGDPFFPTVRHKDFFLGFSWATGAEGGSRQEESSTESINAYHGLAALGLGLGHSDLQAVGQLMLATEIRSVREYFHVRENNRERFPSYIQEYGAIGMFTDESFAYTLNWPCEPNLFPMRHACLIGIQVIPIISVSSYYMDAEWAESVNTVCQWTIDPTIAPGINEIDPDLVVPVQEGWGAFCLAASCRLNEDIQDQAADFVRGMGPGPMVSGTGEAGMMLWIYGAT